MTVSILTAPPLCKMSRSATKSDIAKAIRGSPQLTTDMSSQPAVFGSWGCGIVLTSRLLKTMTIRHPSNILAGIFMMCIIALYKKETLSAKNRDQSADTFCAFKCASQKLPRCFYWYERLQYRVCPYFGPRMSRRHRRLCSAILILTEIQTNVLDNISGFNARLFDVANILISRFHDEISFLRKV